jgi:hypothetical protein
LGGTPAALAKPRFRGGLKPRIQVFIESDVGTVHLAAEVMLAQDLIKVGLGMADRTADDTAVVAPFVGLAVAAKEDAHRPAVRSATYNLPGFSNQTRLLSENLAHRWHNGAGNGSFHSTTWGEGGVRGNQSALHQRHDNNNNNDHGTITKDESPYWKNGSHTQNARSLPGKARVRGWLITGTLDSATPSKTAVFD